MNQKAKNLIELATRELTRAGIESAQIESELLLAHVLGCSREKVVTDNIGLIDESKADLFLSHVKLRQSRYPLQYITQNVTFYSLNFRIKKGIFIPRPETEILVETAVNLIRNRMVNVLDIGTGCGNIAVAIAKNCSNAQITATDINLEALRLARENAQLHAVNDRVFFVACDLFGSLSCRFDFIASNPPYVAMGKQNKELSPEVKYEPEATIDGGPDGLHIVGQIIQQVPNYLSEKGVLLIEIAPDQVSQCLNIAQSINFDSAVIDDLAGLPRILQLKSNTALYL